MISDVYVVLYMYKYCYHRAEEGTEKQSFSEMAAATIFPLWGGAFKDPSFLY